MAKGKPIYLERHLIDSAAIQGQLSHRSVVEQIEHWAALGKVVEELMPGIDTLGLLSGTLILKLKENLNTTIDPVELFDSIERARETSTFSQITPKSSVRYQASTHEGLLECVHSDGRVQLGVFEKGEFIERSP